jgi:hypothetical protein
MSEESGSGDQNQPGSVGDPSERLPIDVAAWSLAEREHFVRTALANLESPPMPDALWDRISHSLAVESAARSAAAASQGAPIPPTSNGASVEAEPGPRRERFGLALAAVSVACLAGIAVGANALATSDSGADGPTLAAAAPVTASGAHYSAPTLVVQVEQKMPTWRADVATRMARAATTAPTPETSTVTLTPGPMTSASDTPTPSGPSEMTMTRPSAADLDECMSSVDRSKPAMYYDIGLYSDTSEPTKSTLESVEKPVVVAVVPNDDMSLFKVYFLAINCTSQDPKLITKILIN